MTAAEKAERKARLAALALREFKARCQHCRIALTPASAPWVPFCSSECRTAAAEVAAMKASR